MDSTELTVFISYSRGDSLTADELVSFLESEGFRVLIDRRDLPFGEAWKSELEYFIAEADCTIWLVSADSIESKWCAWELEQVSARRKRIVPVRLENIPWDRLPHAIGQVHLLPSSGRFVLTEHGALLAKTIRTNQEWIREHTRLSNTSAAWIASGSRGDLLLRGKALINAEHWRDHQPDHAVGPTEQILNFINSSRSAATRRQRFSVLVLLAGLLVAVGLSSWALTSAMSERRARNEAERQKREAYLATSKAFTEESERLFQMGERRRALDLALKAMPHPDRPDWPYLARAEKALYQAVVSPSKPVFFDVPAGSNVTKIHVVKGANIVLLGDDHQFFRPFSMDTGRVRHPYPSNLDALHSQRYGFGGAQVAYIEDPLGEVVVLYDIISNKKSRLKLGVENPTIKDVALSNDGAYLAISWVDSESDNRMSPALVSIFDTEKKEMIYQTKLPYDQGGEPYDDAALRFSEHENALLVGLGAITKRKREIGLDWQNNRFIFDIKLNMKDVLGRVYISPQLSLAVIHEDGQTRIVDLNSGRTIDGTVGSDRWSDSIISLDERFLFQDHVRGEGESLLSAPDYDRVDLNTGTTVAINCDCKIISHWPSGPALLVQALDGEFRIINYDGAIERRIGPGVPGSTMDSKTTTASVVSGASGFIVGGELPRLIDLAQVAVIDSARRCVASREVRWGYTDGKDSIGLISVSLHDGRHCVVKNDGGEWISVLEEPLGKQAGPLGAIPKTPFQAGFAAGGQLGLHAFSEFMGRDYWQYFHGSKFDDLDESVRLSNPIVVDETAQFIAARIGSDEILSISLDTATNVIVRASLGPARWYSISAGGKELLVCRDDGLFIHEILNGLVKQGNRALPGGVDQCTKWTAGAVNERNVILISTDLKLTAIDRASGATVQSVQAFGGQDRHEDHENLDEIRLTLSKTGDRLLVRNGSRNAAVFSTDSWKVLGMHDLSHEKSIKPNQISFSNDFRFAIVDGYEDTIVVSDALGGESTSKFKIDIHSDQIRTHPGGFSIHPYAPRLAVINPAGSGIHIYDLESHEVVGSADLGKRIVSLDYFDDGGQLAIIAQNGTIDLLPAFASYAQLMDAVSEDHGNLK